LDQGSLYLIINLMETQLKSSPEELIQKFKSLKTRSDLAMLLEIKEDFLCKILYGVKERKKYRKFEIQKKSKKIREIHAPPKNLAILQSKLNTILQLVYSPKPCVHGFVKGVNRSILSNANPHKGKRHLINIDLQDFFPSINIYRIKGALMSYPYNIPTDVALVIAQICCRDDGIMPQGSSASPIISNIICRSLDNELMQLARCLKCNYTRYADDITFSTSLFRIPKELAIINNGVSLGKKIISIIEKHNFKINTDKVRYSSPLERQEVTGLTVNEFPNIKRSFIRQIFGILYALEKHGYEATQKRYMDKYFKHSRGAIELKNIVTGKISFLKMVVGEDSPLYRKIVKKFNNLRLSEEIFIKPIEELNPYPLRGKCPKNQPWNKWFSLYKDSVFLLEITDSDRAKHTGTAFYIGNRLLATAKHNFQYKDISINMGNDTIPYESNYPEYRINDNAADAGIIKITSNILDNNPWFQTQLRLPEIGEEVIAIGFPCLSQRNPTLVMHIGVVEALPVNYATNHRFIQVSFQSGGGLSGGPLVDKRGFVVGIMVENIFYLAEPNVPSRPYGQAVPVEYLFDVVQNFSMEPNLKQKV